MRSWTHAGLASVLGLVLSIADAQSAEPRRLAPPAPPEAPTDELEQRTRASIAALEALLPDTTGDTHAELLLRLGELYRRLGRALALREGAATDGAGATPEANAAYEHAIAVDRALLATAPRYRRADEAAFEIGLALEDLGRRKEAADAFLTLTRQYPASGFGPDAFVHLGEWHFDEDRAVEALTAYRHAAASDAPIAVFARYKLAWCQYNLGELREAIGSMEVVLAASRGAPTPGQIALYDEAIDGLVLFLADADDADALRALMIREGQQARLPTLLARIADTWRAQGKNEAAIHLWRSLAAEHADHAQLPAWYGHIADTWVALGDPAQALDALDRMKAATGPASPWRSARAADPAAIAAADGERERRIRAIAFAAHQRGAKVPAAYAIAVRAYQAWLAEFPAHPEAVEVRFGAAELAYTQRRFTDAHAGYRAVVDAAPTGPRARFSAEAAVFAAEQLVKAAKAPTGPAAEALPLSADDERLIAACDAFLAGWPDDPRAEAIIALAGWTLYGRHRYAEAAPRFAQVIARRPGSPEAQQAAHLTLDGLAAVEDWATLADTARAWSEQPDLGTAAFRAEVRGIYQRAQFKRAEVAPDPTAKAAAFLAFADAFPDIPLAATARHNAGVFAAAAGDAALALTIRRRIVDDPAFGTHPHDDADLAALVDQELAIARFDAAADLGERLFARWSAGRRPELAAAAADGLFTAALLRKAAGAPRATADLRAFLDHFGDDPRALDARAALARAWEDRLAWAEAAAAWQAAADAAGDRVDVATLARVRAGRAHLELGRVDAATAAFTAARDGHRAAGAPATSQGPATEAAYQLAGLAYTALVPMKITGAAPTASAHAWTTAITKSTRARLSQLAAVRAHVEDAVRLGDATWGIDALILYGRALEDTAAAVRGSPVPGYLDADQRELYPLTLEDHARGLDERAVESYAAALARARDLRLYDDETAFAARRLGVLRPDDWPRVDEVPAAVVTRGPRPSFEPSL